MQEDYSPLNNDEKLKADNEFMKMKLMLERGAKFGEFANKELPPQLENEFLKNIIEFERQTEEHGYITLFEKLGRPSHFRSVNDISDAEIEKEWDGLAGYLHQHGVSLAVCSPRVTTRELYRFTIEELFQQEVLRANIPGMVHGFIYDEFYPDPVYDNTCAAVNDCIQYILNADMFEWMHNFRDNDLQLNEHAHLSKDQFRLLINQFKKAYDSVHRTSITEITCIVEGTVSFVKGKYSLEVILQNERIQFSGDWSVEFGQDDKWGYWYMHKVEIGGIRF